MYLAWPGLALFLLLLVSCVRGAVRVRHRCAGLPALRDLSRLAEAIWIALGAIAVAAPVNPGAYTVVPYLATALAVAAGATCQVEGGAPPAGAAPAPADPRPPRDTTWT